MKDSAIVTAEENFTGIPNFHLTSYGGDRVYGVRARGLRSGAEGPMTGRFARLPLWASKGLSPSLPDLAARMQLTSADRL